MSNQTLVILVLLCILALGLLFVINTTKMIETKTKEIDQTEKPAAPVHKEEKKAAAILQR